jgi:hypothetical protein
MLANNSMKQKGKYEVGHLQAHAMAARGKSLESPRQHFLDQSEKFPCN